MTTTLQTLRQLIPDMTDTTTSSELELRDLFACAALITLAGNGHDLPAKIATNAYVLADAMLTERTRRPPAA